MITGTHLAALYAALSIVAALLTWAADSKRATALWTVATVCFSLTAILWATQSN